ncbi:MAG: hypothetical protein CR982_04225 [Candidatus Cloacimonadota bacterium]|nr:MAG: hypothetical protein CR982_04225 [Candidatus Cloacimonadota bacterium]PIE78486.1 MAG: hypothetical protein CSA15_07265 [Candidatus Delongbacteria bacterium]
MRYFLFLILLFLISCGKNLDGIDNTPPQKPVIVSQNYDPSFYTESGIRPVSNSNHLRIDWFESEDDDIEGYFLERRELVGSDTTWIRVSNEITSDTTLVDNDLVFENEDTPSRFFYRVIAVDESDNMSKPSNTKNFKLLKKAKILDFYISDGKLVIDAIYQGNIGNETKYAVLRLINGSNIVYAEPKEAFLLDENINFSVDLNEVDIDLNNLYARVDIVNSINGIHTAGSYSQLKLLENN